MSGHEAGVGRGEGGGRATAGVDVGIGVAVGEAVGVGVKVGVGLGVDVGVDVRVGVDVGVGVDVEVAVGGRKVGVGVGDATSQPCRAGSIKNTAISSAPSTTREANRTSAPPLPPPPLDSIGWTRCNVRS